MNKKLDNFETGLGLSPNILSNKDEFKRYLDMDLNQLEKLTYQDCLNIGYRLIQFSLYIQRGLNKEEAISRVLKNKINKIIGPNISSYTGWGDVQRANAILDNGAAESLDEQLLESECRKDRLKYVSSGIKNLADQLKNIQFSKKNNDKTVF